MKKSLMFIFVVFTFFATVYAGIIFLEYSATPSTDRVTVRWTVKPDTQVSRFIVLRSNNDKEFSEIGIVVTSGKSKDYKYVDESVVFRGSHVLFYRIRAVKGDNSIFAETESLIVTPNVSNIYHTWAAIKAMFH